MCVANCNMASTERTLLGLAGDSIARAIRAVFVRFWGLQLAYDERPASTSGAQYVAAVQTALLTTVAGLLVYLRGDSEPDSQVLVVYTSLSLLLLSGFAAVSVINWLKDEKKHHAFDRGAVVLARWSLVIWSLLVGGVTYGYWNKLLPGQRVDDVRLVVAEVRSYSFKNDDATFNIKTGDPGADLVVPIPASKLGPRPYMNPLKVEVSFSPRVADQWQLVEAFEDEEVPGGAGADEPEGPPMLKTGKGPPYVIGWTGLKQGKDYVLVLRLRSKTDSPNLQELRDTINKEDIGITVTAYRRK